MKYLIVNGDDLGAGSGINRGMAEAASRGILTSASLMVNMPGAREAMAMLGGMPHVSIGLHVNLTNEGARPVVNLADDQACRAEIATQLDRFCELTGQLPTHLDSHHNIHRNPLLAPHFQDLARQHDLPLREHSAVRYFSEFYGQWDGETHAEQISVEMLIRMLRTRIGEGYTELSCHPGYRSPDFESCYAVEREMELSALCDPLIGEVLSECGIELTNYRRLRDLN